MFPKIVITFCYESLKNFRKLAGWLYQISQASRHVLFVLLTTWICFAKILQQFHLKGRAVKLIMELFYYEWTLFAVWNNVQNVKYIIIYTGMEIIPYYQYFIWHKATKSWPSWPMALPFKWNCSKIYAKQIWATHHSLLASYISCTNHFQI